MCRVLQVSRAAFYKWSALEEAGPTKSQARRELLVKEIKIIHSRPHLDCYGSPRVVRELAKSGIKCSENTVAKVMKEAGIRAVTARRFCISTTDSKHNLPLAENLLNQDFSVVSLNSVWLTDFTYIHTKDGFTYLCAVEDLCSRRIVGWATSQTIDTELALAALGEAVALRQPPVGLIVHSDRGSQFASLAYRQRLERHLFKQSMSRKGNCYDNAPMESFYRSYKVEEVHRKKYETHEHASRHAVDYIERFYNRNRMHSSLDYLSPIEFELRLQKSK
jgi:transposase InsO family protein